MSDSLRFADLLPPSVSGDAKFRAAAQVLDTELDGVRRAVPEVLIWAQLDTMTGRKLDLLAWQLHVDDYVPDWPDETKRQAVRESIKIHKYKGTPWAVRRAVEIAAGASAEVSENFDYGGEPYHFKVAVSGRMPDAESYGAVVTAANSAKNLRSKLEAVQAVYDDGAELNAGGVGVLGISLTGDLDHTVNLTDTPLCSGGIGIMCIPLVGRLPEPVADINPADMRAGGIAHMPVIVAGYLTEDFEQ